jgi:Fe-S cluster biogenesis protein NfuA/iron-sulfur cluster repair protein YtfE (RIC family)
LLIRAKIQAALDELRPYVQADGGDVELVSVDGNTVTVRMAGSCVGCPSSEVTLKSGIEKHLKKAVPEVEQVVQAAPLPGRSGPLRRVPLVSPLVAEPRALSATNSVGATLPAIQRHADDLATPPPTPRTAAESPESITASLRAVHRRAESLLDDLDAALTKIKSGDTSSETVQTLQKVERFLSSELQVHMRQEDEVLFPALIPHITWGAPMSAMAKEHVHLHDELDAFSRVVQAYKPGQPADELVKMGRKVAEHLRDDFFQEESVLFVQADGSLTGQRAAVLREAMERIARAASRE